MVMDTSARPEDHVITSEEEFDRVVRVTIYLTDLGKFTIVNDLMAAYFREPFPARVTIGVASLPRGSAVEIDAVMHLGK